MEYMAGSYMEYKTSFPHLKRPFEHQFAMMPRISYHITSCTHPHRQVAKLTRHAIMMEVAGQKKMSQNVQQAPQAIFPEKLAEDYEPFTQ